MMDSIWIIPIIALSLCVGFMGGLLLFRRRLRVLMATHAEVVETAGKISDLYIAGVQLRRATDKL